MLYKHFIIMFHYMTHYAKRSIANRHLLVLSNLMELLRYGGFATAILLNIYYIFIVCLAHLAFIL